MELSERHKKIIDIVKKAAPITSEQIAQKLGLTRSAIRAELSVLTMSGILEAKPRVGYSYCHTVQLDQFRQKLANITVRDVSSLPVVINENESVYDGIVAMFLENVGSLIVLSNGRLAGIVSRKDIIKASMGHLDVQNVPIGLIMTRMPNLHMAYPTDNIYNAAKRLIDHGVDSLPVVEKKEKAGDVFYEVIGRLTKTTVTKLFVEVLEQTNAEA